MTRPLNGHRSTESTTSIATAANQGIRHLQGRPPPIRSTSEGRLDMGHDRPRTSYHANRRSGGFFALGNGGFAPDPDTEHRATWAGSEYTWQQGYHAGRSTDQREPGRSDLRANRLRDAQLQGGGPFANGPGTSSHSHTNGLRTPADAPLTDESALGSNKGGLSGHLHAAKPLPLPFNHGVLFTAEGFMADEEQLEELEDGDASALAFPPPTSLGRQYQLPALGSVGDFQIQSHLFTGPDIDDTPKGSPTDSTTPTPTATTFAESHQRTLHGELGRLEPTAQRHVAQAVVNANSHTKDMLAGTEELLSLLAWLRKGRDPPPRNMPPYRPRPPVQPVHMAPNARFAATHLVKPAISRSPSTRTIRNMVRQSTTSRRATMLSTMMAPNSDESDEGATTTDGTTTETDEGSLTTGTTESNPSSPDQRVQARYSEDRALGSFLQLIERRGITQPEVEALRQHMPAPASAGMSRQPSGLRRSHPHRAHSKIRRSKKKRRSKKDKEREREREEPPLLPSASGSESEGLGFDVWEDVGKGDLSDFMSEIMDVAKWYNLPDAEAV